MKRRPLWWRRLVAALAPRRSLKIVEDDMLPEKLPLWNSSWLAMAMKIGR